MVSSAAPHSRRRGLVIAVAAFSAAVLLSVALVPFPSSTDTAPGAASPAHPISLEQAAESGVPVQLSLSVAPGQVHDVRFPRCLFVTFCAGSGAWAGCVCEGWAVCVQRDCCGAAAVAAVFPAPPAGAVLFRAAAAAIRLRPAAIRLRPTSNAAAARIRTRATALCAACEHRNAGLPTRGHSATSTTHAVPTMTFCNT
jgi:hypothetical protein